MSTKNVDIESMHDHWIGGRHVPPASGKTFAAIDPSDDSVIAEVALGSAGDIDAAVASANQAFDANRGAGPSQREAWLLSAADLLQRNAEDFAERLIRDTASPITKARREIATSVGVLRAAAGAARRMTGAVVPSDVGGRYSLAIREPLGVVAGILPFNVPLIKSVKHSALALAVGNAVVLMPSDRAPLVASRLAKLYADAGVPAGLLNVVFGHGPSIGDALTDHSDVAAIGFTGSTATARHVASVAARTGKPVTLEMGGKNAAVVLADADLEKTVMPITMSAFLFQGQICMSTSIVYVEATIADQLVDRMIRAASMLKAGDLRDPATVRCPMIDQGQRQRVQRHLDDAVDRGAVVHCGGTGDGRGFAPTILTGVDPGSLVATEETFGPVLTIQPVDGIDEALQRINQSRFGLVASIFTDSHAAALHFVRRCGVGMVHVNGPTVQEEAHVPFGGNRDSGMGREGAIVGIDELTRWKWATIG